MGLNRIPRNAQCTILIIVLLSLTCMGYDYDAEPSETDDATHSNKPRFIRIFSRAHPEGEKQMGIGLRKHIHNVLNGGTIGLHTEFTPRGPVRSFLDVAKKMIPETPYYPGTFDDSKGKGFPEIPDKFPEEKDIPVWTPDNNSGNMESENEDWEHQDPKKPNEGGSKWEDIGEEVDDKDYEKVPIEDIIQPRGRPKRFADSLIFHVPLEFRSNAKPYQVKFPNHFASK